MASKREQARIRAEALRKEAEARALAERRRERFLRAGISVGILVVVAVIAIVLVNRATDDPQGTGAIPSGTVEGGTGVAVGEADAPVTIDYWFDFQCPFCGQFEAENGPVLEELVADGTAQVVYHPAAFLGEESDRASNAFGCAIDAGRPVEYLTELFANQPEERSGGYTTDDLLAAGEAAGLDDAVFESCVREGTYADWGRHVLDAFRDEGLEATPAVLLNGEPLDDPAAMSADEFRSAVDAAVTTS
ncbi:DsbA family protein [Jiangella rhizosphaerae]|uniref:Disulfide bond formation protein DsbA n=1 Tax=Jiangella rhizosphaerae TaxID=2293569 RepID=A0A418KVI8_9ACTN|nr:thioredoxin domain-containing protein [Jiangella rhizosphaerae]RIQ32469.1 disulfide bond formation protein DsbA [Jiangella rhizosphaerae]